MKFLIVDDHALIRDALQGVLKRLQRGAIVLEAGLSFIGAGDPNVATGTNFSAPVIFSQTGGTFHTAASEQGGLTCRITVNGTVRSTQTLKGIEPAVACALGHARANSAKHGMAAQLRW